MKCVVHNTKPLDVEGRKTESVSSAVKLNEMKTDFRSFVCLQLSSEKSAFNNVLGRNAALTLKGDVFCRVFQFTAGAIMRRDGPELSAHIQNLSLGRPHMLETLQKSLKKQLEPFFFLQIMVQTAV